MLFVRGFALLLLVAFAALALNTAVPQRDFGKVAARAALLSAVSQTQTLASVVQQGDCGEAAACEP
jgi:hypothetical protein